LADQLAEDHDMPRLQSLRLEVWGLLLLAFAGCQKGEKIELDYTAVLEPSEEKFFPLTALERDTPVTVAVDSAGIKVEIYIFKAQSEEEATSMLRKQNPTDILASSLKKPNPKLNTTLAAYTRYVLTVVNPPSNSNIMTKPARVSIKITNRQD
jgi:hypothetical protein